MANPIRTTENSGNEADGYTVVNDEDDIGEVLYHVSPQGDGEADVTRYGPSADGVGDADEEDKLPQRVPPAVANEILDLGFTQITVGETVMATEDPANPAVGDEWYRTDLGVLRRQTPQGIAETRDFYRPGEDFEYTDFGIAPVTVLEEGFEDIDLGAANGWTVINSVSVSVTNEEASNGTKSLKLANGDTSNPGEAQYGVNLKLGDGITIEFGALGAPVIAVQGTLTGGGSSAEVSADLSVPSISGSLLDGFGLELPVDDLPGNGWVSYTVDVSATEFSVIATRDGGEVSDSVALTGDSVDVETITFGAGEDARTSYIDAASIEAGNLPNGTRLSPQITEEDIAPNVELGGGSGLSEDSVTVTELNTSAGPSGEIFQSESLWMIARKFSAVRGLGMQQGGDPAQADIPIGGGMVYVSDGSGFGSAGDMVYAFNDGGTIKATKLAEVANMTAL